LLQKLTKFNGSNHVPYIFKNFSSLIFSHPEFAADAKLKREQFKLIFGRSPGRVSVQGVVSLGGHFATFCREFDFYEVKNNITIFQK
jgi:hypothetical protein